MGAQCVYVFGYLGVSVADWTMMEGFASVQDYLRVMRVPHTWIDTPMLVAASAVFHVQFVCFLGRGEPHLLAAPDIVQSSADVPVGFLANSDNVHFYACHPTADVDGCEEVSGMDPAGDTLKASMISSAGAFEPSADAQDTEPSEDQLSRGLPNSLPLTSDSIFALCHCLNTWGDIFSAPSDELSAMLRAVETSTTDNSAASAFEVLRWRDAIKLLQWESLEQSAGMDRSNVYQIAKHHQKHPRHGRYKQFVKSRKILNKLVLQNIVEALAKTCDRHAGHTCLDAFRAQPTVVLRWRKLWY